MRRFSFTLFGSPPPLTFQPSLHHFASFYFSSIVSVPFVLCCPSQQCIHSIHSPKVLSLPGITFLCFTHFLLLFFPSVPPPFPSVFSLFFSFKTIFNTKKNKPTLQMNLVLETFERVLSPNGGSATRRASALGFSAHNHQQQPQIGDSHQMAIDGGRRRSGGGANILSQFTQGNSQMPMTSVGSCVTVFDPLKGCTTETVQMRRELEATDTTERAEAEMGADKTRSRSRSGARRKKSAAGNHPRKQSMVSLLFSAISSSTPSNRRRTRLPPPRQWSVPERGSLNPNTEDEPFRLVQKECSMSSSPSSSFSNQRTPSAERMSRKRLLGSQTGVIAPNDGHSQFVLFGFAVGQQTSLNRFSSDRSSSLAESHFLTQFGQIRQCPSIFRALLLRCVDPEPLYPFLHYATFSTYGKGTEMADGMNRMSVGQTEFVSFEEVIALERQMGDTFGASPPSECLSRAVHADLLGSSVHGGFIVLCFRLLDGQTGNNLQLENTWLSWTGANQIYKYSPRSWQLRRLSLLRRVPFSAVRSFPSSSSCSSSSPFAFSYVLLCEFGSILHPSNALAALDMCERLRTRNCGTVSLYQVRHRFAIPSNVPAFSSSSSSPNCHYFSSPTVPNSLSPHLSPLQIRRSGDVHRLARMGSSQEVPDSDSGVTQRRKMLLRMREKSLGWDGGRTDTAL